MQGAPTLSEHTRSKDFTPDSQQASGPPKSPPSLPPQPEPPQDPQLVGQQTVFVWMPGIPPSQVEPEVEPGTVVREKNARYNGVRAHVGVHKQ